MLQVFKRVKSEINYNQIIKSISMATKAAAGDAQPAGNKPPAVEDDDNIQQLTKFLKLLKQAPNEALMGLIVDSLVAELANKPHRLQLVMDFALKELPKCDEDFIRLKVSEKLLPLYLQYSTKSQAEAILSKYNLAVSAIDPNSPKDKQQRAQQRALERLERSIQIIKATGLNTTASAAQGLIGGGAGGPHKMVTIDSLLHGVDTAISADVAQKHDKEVGRIASEFFKSLIQNYDPLVASATSSANDQNAQQADLPGKLPKLHPTISIQSVGDTNQSMEAAKDRTKKQIESAVMGGYQNLKSVKLSDFIDESFLEDLVRDIKPDRGAKKSDKKALSQLMQAIADKSSVTLPELSSNSPTSAAAQNAPSAPSNVQANKRRKISATNDVQMTHLVLSPYLALILNQTEYLLNQDWRRRQIAACNLRGILSTLNRRKIDRLEYWTVQRSSEDNQLRVCESRTVPLTDLIRNVLPRLLLFILKDNFSDFAGLKVQAPAREEAMKLLAEIQINADKTQNQAVQKDVQLLIRVLPAIFIAVEHDVWHSRLNFFLIIKALVLRSAPESKMRQQILRMFSQLLINALPQIEDEPKVAITEILQILLPTYLKLAPKLGKQKTAAGPQANNVLATIGQLLQNLTYNLAQSDEVEASSIAVFNLVCRVFDLKDEYACLADLKFKMQLDVFCPFNFHKIESVRYSYNLLLSKIIAQKENACLSTEELGSLHTLVVQALAMETTPKIVKLLYKNLERLVAIFGELEENSMTSANAEQAGKEQLAVGEANENMAAEGNAAVMSEESPYARYLRQNLLLDNSLPAWLFDVQPNFDSFLFFESENFESIDRDYFQIVFRPANVHEWEKFYFDKTENLTRAIAIMLANCRNLDAANLIFSMMCCHTLVYDQNPENDQYVQRTLLNQSMLHLMMTMDRYTRQLGKQVRQGKRNIITAGHHGILDLSYLLNLSGEFLGAQEKDVNVNECWQRDDLHNCLNDLNEYVSANQIGGIYEQIGTVYNCLQSFAARQNYEFEVEFCQAVDTMNDWIQQYGDGNLMNYMFAFYQQYQYYTYFAVEYVSRLKAQAASIILNLASICHEPTKDPIESDQIFPVDREFIMQTASDIVKPLLNIVNQERIQFFKKWSAQALVKLLRVAKEHNLAILNRKTLTIIVKMMEQASFDDIDSMGTQRLQTCEFFCTELIKQTRDVTVFEDYGGVIGNLLLKPAWAQMQTNQMIGVSYGPETEQAVHFWAHAVLTFVRSQVATEGKTISDALQTRYKILGFGALIKLIVKAIQILGQSEILQVTTEFPSLLDLLFPRLTTRQRNTLIEALVVELEAQSRMAFDCLDRLLQTQLVKGTSSQGAATFFKYLPAFVLPVIKAIQASQKIYPITDANTGVMKILAKLIQLLPLKIATLEQSQATDQEDPISEKLAEMTEKGLEFLAVFAENRIVSEYEIIVPLKAESGVKLRDYQKEGINWMAQLGYYNLNCALCDDMGLGKTLQSLCVVLNESEKIKQAQIKEHGEVIDRPCNLVICPTTLTYNWKYEVQKFFEGQQVCVIEGNQAEREFQLDMIDQYDIIIINYEKVKKCLPQFLEKEFFYIILDEAHKIKNSKSVVTQSVKQLKGKRKLALSGTPLQNRVAELWSLFDFLMPDFLEEESVFNKTYNKYLTANIKKMTENLEETESFINALKSLKRRIAPFILRRTKEQVLKELPPKVIQDYPCSMPSFQQKVHEEIEKRYPFAANIQQKSQQQASGQAVSASGGQPKQHKQALHNLILHRKVCNHPSLVKESLQDFFESAQQAKTGKQSQASMQDYTASGKLLGLIEVLQQTEIISSSAFGSNSAEETKQSASATISQHETSLADYATMTDADGVVAQADAPKAPHRALIFCQMSSCLELVCNQVLQRFGIKYKKLLGSFSSQQRLQIVNEFNHDSSVRVLILTTAVGGLGLTLTGADVVIFMEHDWNPMNDLQAMDRAHRIGQTRTVNVFRLIMRDTIEDKIMNLQRFKENLAKSLIQARGGDVSTTDVANLELTDLLKSFEEHTGYQAGTRTDNAAKSSAAAAKDSAFEKATGGQKGAKVVKQLVGGGLPGVGDIGGMDRRHGAGGDGDTELANIEKIWQAVSDDVENM